MKRSIILFLGGLFLSLGVCQGQEFSDIRATIDNLFADLDKSKVPTGLLRDYAVELTDLSAYNGTIRDDNLINFSTYELILKSIRSSAVGVKPFIEVSEAIESMRNRETQSDTPISIVAFKYNYIKSDALANNLLNYDSASGKVADRYVAREGEHNTEMWVNPYDSSFVYAAASIKDLTTSPFVNYIFDPDWTFSNLDILSIEFDAGLGQGYQMVNIAGDSFDVYYGGQGGVFEIKTRITITDGTVLESHGSIFVVNTYNIASPMDIEPDLTQDFTSRAAMVGYTPQASVSIKFANDSNGQLINPLIVAEGFDPFPYVPSSPYFGKGGTTLSDFNGSTLLNKFDIVYIDWHNSFASIESNADILIQVIEWVNSIKQSSNPNVVLGYSMGGLVARYALARMEQEGVEHNTSTYISYDTPHLGAHIPLGYVYLARDLLNSGLEYYFSGIAHLALPLALFYMVYLTPMWAWALNIKDAVNIIDAYSAKQMLYYYVNEEHRLDNSIHDSWQESLNAIGFPKGSKELPLRRLAITNGGNSSTIPSQHLHLRDTLSYNAGWQTLNSLASTFEYMLMGDIFHATACMLSIFIPRNTTFFLEADVFPYIGSSQEVCYSKLTISKKLLWLVDIQETVHEKHSESPASGFSIETVPASTYFIKKDSISLNKSDTIDLGLNNTLKLKMRNNFPFVPTASSLCYKNGEDLSESDYHTDFFTPSLTTLHKTPFDSYYAESEASGHIYDLRDVYLWLIDACNFAINGPEVLSVGDSLSVSPISYSGGTWSTADTSNVSISPSGVVKRISRRGETSIHYSGYDSYSRPYDFSRYFFAGGMPQFDLSYEKQPFPLSNNNLAEYRITAKYVKDSGAGLSLVKVFWGETESLNISINGEGPSITWTESTSFTYYTSIPRNRAKYILIKVQYDNFITPIKILSIKNPCNDTVAIVTKEGEIIPLEHDLFPNDDAQLNESVSFILDDMTIDFEGTPDTALMLSSFLKSPSFVNQVKNLRPWGEEEVVLIPVQAVEASSEEAFDTNVKLIYYDEQKNY